MTFTAFKRLLLSILCAGLVHAAPAAAQHFPADDDLRLMLRYLVEDAGIAGIVLGVLEPDGTTRVVSYGSPGPGAQPLARQSVFEIGSLTKPFTTTLLVEMAQRGEVALDDPVANYLPPGTTVPSFAGDVITLRHLALHTSGLPRGPDNHRPADEQDPYAGYTAGQGFEFLEGYTLQRRPGARHEYSNFGYGLLGFALAQAAGIPLPELMRERVLEPLGLVSTQYGRDGVIAEWLVRGHDGQQVVPYWSAPEVVQGAGGLYSSADDLLRFMQANVAAAESPLHQAMRRAHQTEVPISGGGTGQALGWRTITAPDGSVAVTHSGYSGGFSVEMVFRPDIGAGMVTLANAADAPTRLAIPMTIMAPPPPAWQQVDVSPAVLQRLAGEYRADNGAGIYVRLEDEGFLTYQPRGNVRARLYALSDTTFFVLRSPWSLTFRRSGEHQEVVISPDGRGPDAGATPAMVARKVSDGTPSPITVAAGLPPGAADAGLGRWGIVLAGSLALGMGILALRQRARSGTV